RLLIGIVGTRRLKSQEILTSTPLLPLLTQVQREMGVRRAVAVRQTVPDAPIVVPLTWGWLRPTLLLPTPFLTWPEERLRMILLHELAHIQRADWLFQILAQLTCAVYWFH